MRLPVLGLGALAAAMVMLPADASAQNRKTRERLEAIEQQLRDLQGIVFGEDGSGAPVRFKGANPSAQERAAEPSRPARQVALSPETQLRLSGVEQEIQRLTGEIERLTYQLRQQQSRIDRLVELVYPDYEERVSLGLVGQRELLGERASAPEAAGPGGGASRPVDLVAGGAASAALPGYGDAASAYNAGRNALFAGRFPEAERAFLALTENYPDSEEYADGLFFLGETYLAQGDLRASAEAYLDFIRNFGDNPRAARAHLKLGEAFIKADKSREACRVWLRGVQIYPDMEDELMADIRSRQVEAECPGVSAPEDE